MYPPRLRFTVRRMMVAVAILGVVLGTVRFWPIAQEYRRSADSWETQEAWVAKSIAIEQDLADRWAAQIAEKDAEIAKDRDGTHKQMLVALRGYCSRCLAENRTNLDSMHRRRSHCASMRIKYRHASRYPWLFVAPDPPYPN